MKLLRIIPLFLLLALSLSSTADALDQLMVKSGISQQIAAIGSNINSGLQQGGQELPQATLNALVGIMETHFAAEKLNADIRQVLSLRLSANDITQSLAWYDTELGKRLVTLEIAATQAESQAAQHQQIPKLLEQADRFSLIRELDAATGASKANLAMASSMQKTMMFALLGKSMKQAEIDQLVQLSQASMKAELEMMVLGGMLYTYRDVSDADLRRYQAFAQTAAGKAFHQAVSEAMIRTMENTGRDVGAEMSKFLQQ